MPLANYTTEVTAIKSVGEIQGLLTGHGARSILIDYKDGEPIALAFIIPTKHGDLPFRLPANIEKVQVVLKKMRSRNRWNPNADRLDRERALKVAWRILRDWVRAQLAIIETEMVTIDQVFLPYMTHRGKTVYEIFVEGHLQLPQGNDDGEFHEVKE